jgi:putative transposase
MEEETQRFGVEMLAYSLLRDHVNLIAVPDDERSLARAIGNAHRRYTRMRNFDEGVRGYLFQGRFSSCALDDRHLVAAARFAEIDPIVSRAARRAWDYEGSSAAFHAAGRRKDPLVGDRGLRGLVKDWKAMLAEKDDEAEKRFLLCIRTGRPAGNDKFILRLEKLTGRTLRKGKPGPKARDEA